MKGRARPRRIALLVAYDGTDFVGWQRQPNGRSVQEVLEGILSRLSSNAPVTVIGAGRTDSGVHGGAVVAHADVPASTADDELLRAIRRMAPSDLGILGLTTVDDDFHARFSARERRYLYRIHHLPDPFAHRFSWLIDRSLDLPSMREASSHLIGAHDFTSLSKNNPDTKGSDCIVRRARWIEREGGLIFEIAANRFLYGMVRLTVGLLVDIGMGRRPAGDLERLLASRERRDQSQMAPARGLTLAEVSYDRPIFPHAPATSLFDPSLPARDPGTSVDG